MSDTLVLGLETSCDETSAALLRGEREILGHVILSQDVHEVYGGVVPELAARAHLQKVDDVVDEALRRADRGLDEVEAVAVTAGPGLIGALLVGVSWAKAVAFALGRPIVPVHHMEAHLFGPLLEDPRAEPPFVALLVSGGHTLLILAEAWGDYLLLGETRDDAAGEAFDKVAKLLGLPYPGGPAVERLAAVGDPERHPLPRPMLRGDQAPGDADYYDFSFSGLKTAVATLVRELEEEGRVEAERAHVAAAFQEAAVDALVAKTMRAVKATGCSRVLVGGGVSANGRLREELDRRLGAEGSLFRASPRLSLDNGAVVARCGLFRLDRGEVGDLDLSARADLPFPGLERARPSGVRPGDRTAPASGTLERIHRGP
ncbi:MAG: tRNA (adenosine(37)-N6)-threonylcarbamoyltransferase complex transferase subunit TsaD [Gemmatimonadetes bacterium]|nr:tRNA (adenosine(37)-N6)-threonylcarbamoyltransferase complex transferase subunit TsaD [Gemmatimonadota bacterium]NIR78697.1 tRNA (adenosine(37)-N6)-threonylcarbamoyltransferase complex transferase subunit TsaD [Gemmatimonadota bacterium]NIT87336.1 tRNA (adenosine(37)-N6)-threonylcarbamoyltransferase complex transferase subunit TsaD [Gemmatimonadota bacterium]NIU31180.1 tRNA (adenosine(37)-N6)-threonylcarbamoyltransferase complex transferase subunit TsaD [Gemmatimonadota bacterium]NIU35902.1 